MTAVYSRFVFGDRSLEPLAAHHHQGIALTLLTALSVLTLSMILPSLPAMSRDLDARASVVALVVSGYMLVAALFQVVLGPVSDRLGRPAGMLAATLASLACSFSFGWLYAAPMVLLVAVALAYNLFAISDSSVYATALAEVVPAHSIGAAYSVRSVTGFAAGALSPWVFGLALDAGRAWWGESTASWALAWSTLALGALPGPFMIAAMGGRPVSRRSST